MDHGPRRQLVQRVLKECLALIRRSGECADDEFAQAASHLPALLRDAAAQLADPTEAAGIRREAPALTGYALWADCYDEEFDNPVVAAEEDIIHEVIGPPAGLRVLDVGCGTGRHAVRLAAAGAQVLGLDPTPNMLARARRTAAARGVHLQLKRGDLESLDAARGEFDLVLCCLVLSHVPDLGRAAAALARRVAPGGRLILTDFHPVNLLIGLRTAFTHRGQRYIVPNFLHPVGSYFSALGAAGLTVTRLCEVGEWPDLPGVPTTLLIEGRRPASG